MSLQTGGPVARTVLPVIDPNNLKIEGFYCLTNDRQQQILLSQDIRDILSQGIVVNDHTVLTDESDLVRLQDILRIKYAVLGKKVVTQNGRKLGKVEDYACDTQSMYIQKLYVVPTFIKGLAGGQLGVDRSQIVEITNDKIIVQDLEQRVQDTALATT